MYLLSIQWLLADNLVPILSINPALLLISLWIEMHPMCPCTCREHKILYSALVHIHVYVLTSVLTYSNLLL